MNKRVAVRLLLHCMTTAILGRLCNGAMCRLHFRNRCMICSLLRVCSVSLSRSDEALVSIVASSVVISGECDQGNDEEGNEYTRPLTVLPATAVPGAWQYRRPSGAHLGWSVVVGQKYTVLKSSRWFLNGRVGQR